MSVRSGAAEAVSGPAPLRQLVEHYSHGEDVVPTRYAALIGVYAAGVAGFSLLFHRSGRRLPARIGAGDIALLGVATFKLSRLIARDKVTSFLRAPFTRYKGQGPASEVQEEPRGEGLRRGVGELATCPFCMGQWAGTALMGLYLVDAPAARTVAALLSAVTVSDALQYAETALHRTAG
ncbi:MAG TPA: DUF1360 domain-containing protein [Acidimicrobiales bacterium]|nr:DUF1360 domain-containing protein [Acidimicrobiales bacterium]